jgi:RAC serine/threonine-protein kinase
LAAKGYDAHASLPERPGNYIRNWRPRWFKLKDGILYYYKEPDEEATNFFVMAGARIQSFEKLGINCFEIIMANGDRRYIQANSKKERDEWIASLNTSAERKQRLVNSATSQGGISNLQPLSPTAAVAPVSLPPTSKDAPSAGPTSPQALNRKDDAPIGEVHLQHLNATRKKKISPDDFIFLKVLGKGNYGKVRNAHFEALDLMPQLFFPLSGS